MATTTHTNVFSNTFPKESSQDRHSVSFVGESLAFEFIISIVDCYVPGRFIWQNTQVDEQQYFLKIILSEIYIRASLVFKFFLWLMAINWSSKMLICFLY